MSKAIKITLGVLGALILLFIVIGVAGGGSKSAAPRA
jgi:hypothetical protein